MKASLRPENVDRNLEEAVRRWKELADRDFALAEDYAFAACGCQVAYPTWWVREDGPNQPVDCLHLECRIRRREFRRPDWLVRFTDEFRGELSNWLRFAKETETGRRQIARIYWTQKRKKTFDIMACVWTGVLA
jgi:hypothetical protein